MADLIQKTDTLNGGREKLNEAIKDADTAKVDASSAKTTANQALAKSTDTQTQLDTIVIEGDSSVEAAQARVDTKGNPHTTLKARLDAEQSAVTSQLAETEQDINSRGINVLNPPVPMIAAKGNGTDDDSSAIQNIINNFPIVFIPKTITHYLIGSTIKINKPVTIFSNGALLKGNGVGIINTELVDGVYVDGLFFETGDNNISCFNISQGTQNIEVRKCKFANAKNGIVIYPSNPNVGGSPIIPIKNVIIEENVFENLYSTGINAWTGGDKADVINFITIKHNVFRRIGVNGNTLDNRGAMEIFGKNITIAFNKIIDCRFSGVNINGDDVNGNWSEIFNVYENEFECNEHPIDMAIRVRHAKNGTIQNNVLPVANTNEIILVWKTDNVSILNNTIIDTVVLHPEFIDDFAPREGIVVYHNSTNTTVKGNTIKDSPKPIYVLGIKTVVESNHIMGGIAYVLDFANNGTIENVVYRNNTFEKAKLYVSYCKESIFDGNTFTYFDAGTSGLMYFEGDLTGNEIRKNKLLKPYAHTAITKPLFSISPTSTSIISMIESNDFGGFEFIRISNPQKQKANSWQFRTTKPIDGDGNFTLKHAFGNFIENPNYNKNNCLKGWICSNTIPQEFEPVYETRVGPTSGRPTNAKQGVRYVDTTINKPIFFDGTFWRDFAGTAV